MSVIRSWSSTFHANGQRGPSSSCRMAASGPPPSTTVHYPNGDPQNPLSWDELRAKYRELGRSVLPEDRLDEICQSVQCAESPADVAPIWRRLRPTVGPDV